MQIIKGESIQKELELCDIFANFHKLDITPQTLKYYFKLQDPRQIKKALKLNDILTNWSGQTMECTNENGFLCITTPTTERQTTPITKFIHLKDGDPNSVIIGVDEQGNPQSRTIDELTHLLIAGTTGSGKSVCLNSIIIGLCCYNNPKDLGIILIDPKKVEFNIYNKLPHLLTPIVTETQQTEKILNNLVQEMETRYKIMQSLDIEKNNGHFKKIIVIIDELADLVLANKNIKNLLIKLLQKSRAAGIHFIVATQSPRASILNGLILANLPSRLALTCASARESMLILGHKGAEKLTGAGDAIFKSPKSIKEIRVQIPLITKQQIRKLLNN